MESRFSGSGPKRSAQVPAFFFFSFGLLEERQLREPIGVLSTNFWKTLDAQLARRPRAEIPRLPVSTVWH